MIASLLIAAALTTQQPSNCPNGQCYRSGVRVQAPFVDVQVGGGYMPPPVVYSTPAPAQTQVIVRRGLFGRVRVFVIQ